MSKKVCAIALLVVCMLMTSVAFAQLNSQLSQQKVVVIGGQETFVSADKVAPGDVIEYTAEYTNNGKNPANDVKANMRVPQGTTLIAGSATPADLLATIDGQHFAKYPITRTVKSPDGTTVEKEVPTSEYKALRWNLGAIALGSSKKVKVRVRVNP